MIIKPTKDYTSFFIQFQDSGGHPRSILFEFRKRKKAGPCPALPCKRSGTAGAPLISKTPSKINTYSTALPSLLQFSILPNPRTTLHTQHTPVLNKTNIKITLYV
jgi:hypothetical protein